MSSNGIWIANLYRDTMPNGLANQLWQQQVLKIMDYH